MKFQRSFAGLASHVKQTCPFSRFGIISSFNWTFSWYFVLVESVCLNADSFPRESLLKWSFGWFVKPVITHWQKTRPDCHLTRSQVLSKAAPGNTLPSQDSLAVEFQFQRCSPLQMFSKQLGSCLPRSLLILQRRACTDKKVHDLRVWTPFIRSKHP